jgi:hypothetical protein
MPLGTHPIPYILYFVAAHPILCDGTPDAFGGTPHPILCGGTLHPLWRHIPYPVAAHPILCDGTPDAFWGTPHRLHPIFCDRTTHTLWWHTPSLMAAYVISCGDTPDALLRHAGCETLLKENVRTVYLSGQISLLTTTISIRYLLYCHSKL